MIFFDVLVKLLVHGVTLGASILGAAYTMYRFNSPIAQQNNGEEFLRVLDTYHLRVPCYAPCGNDIGYSYYAQSAPFQFIGLIVSTAVIYLGLSLLVGILPGRSDSYLRFMLLRFVCVSLIATFATVSIYSTASSNAAQATSCAQDMGRVLDVAPAGTAEWNLYVETFTTKTPYSFDQHYFKVKGSTPDSLKRGDFISFESMQMSSLPWHSEEWIDHVERIDRLPGDSHLKLLTYRQSNAKLASIYDDGNLVAENNIHETLDADTLAKVKLLCHFVQANPKSVPLEPTQTQPTLEVFPNVRATYEIKPTASPSGLELIALVENELSKLEKQCDYRVSTGLVYRLSDWNNQPPIDDLMPANFEFNKKYEINEKFRNDSVPWFTPRGYYHYRGRNAIYMIRFVSDKWKDAEIYAYQYEMLPLDVNFKYPATYYNKEKSIISREEFETRKEFYGRFLGGKRPNVLLVRGNDIITELSLVPYQQ